MKGVSVRTLGKGVLGAGAVSVPVTTLALQVESRDRIEELKLDFETKADKLRAAQINIALENGYKLDKLIDGFDSQREYINRVAIGLEGEIEKVAVMTADRFNGLEAKLDSMENKIKEAFELNFGQWDGLEESFRNLSEFVNRMLLNNRNLLNDIKRQQTKQQEENKALAEGVSAHIDRVDNGLTADMNKKYAVLINNLSEIKNVVSYIKTNVDNVSKAQGNLNANVVSKVDGLLETVQTMIGKQGEDMLATVKNINSRLDDISKQPTTKVVIRAKDKADVDYLQDVLTQYQQTLATYLRNTLQTDLNNILIKLNTMSPR